MAWWDDVSKSVKEKAGSAKEKYNKKIQAGTKRLEKGVDTRITGYKVGGAKGLVMSSGAIEQKNLEHESFKIRHYRSQLSDLGYGSDEIRQFEERGAVESVLRNHGIDTSDRAVAGAHTDHKLAQEEKKLEQIQRRKEIKKRIWQEKFKRIKFWALIIGGIVGSIYLIWLLFFSKMGSGIGGTGITSARSGIFNMFTNAESEFNVGKQILTGQYDPSQLWSSQIYQDKYSTQATERGPGIYITRLEPLRDPFPTDSMLVIFGQMEAESITGESLTIRISATSDTTEEESEMQEKGFWEFLSGEAYKEVFEELFNGVKGYAWACEPSNIVGQRVFAGRFQCVSNYGLSGVEKGYETAERVVVNVDYDFKAVGGKQIYVANANELDAIWVANQDPLVYYGVSSDATASWSTPGSIEMGMKVAGLDEDIIPANDNGNKIPSYLEVKIHNRGDGNATLKGNLEIQIPLNVVALSGADTDFEKLKCEEGICTYLAPTDGTSIEPGLAKVYYFKFKACDGEQGQDCSKDFLYGAPVSSFFALSEVEYSYRTQMATTVKAKNIAGSETNSDATLIE